MSECQARRILLVDDDEDDYILTRDMLCASRGRKCQLDWAANYEDGCRALQTGGYDAVLIDYDLGPHRGLELIHAVSKAGYPSPFILLTGRGSYEIDLEAMQAGVTLYLTKDEINPLLLERSIRYAIERKQSEQALAEANALLLRQKQELEEKNRQLNEAMQEAEHSRAQLEAIFEAQNDAVLIYDMNMNVQRVNPSFQTAYGFDPVGMNVREIIQRVSCRWLDGRPLILEEQPTPRALRGEKVSGASFLVRRGDGSEAVVATSSGPMRVGGQIAGSVTVWHDVTQLHHLEAERSQRTAQVEVQRRLAEYREIERQELARNLHDGPIQELIGIIFNMKFAQEAIKDPALVLELEQIGLSLKSIVSELRDVVNELRPPSLIRFGVSKAFQVHAAEFREKNPQIELTLDLPPIDGQLSEPLCLTMFRIYQEGLRNIVRHARASHVWVCFALENDQARLEIKDNGCGFVLPDDLADHTLHGHYGLAGMRERAEAQGGRWQISSAPGEGTIVQVTVPVKS